MSRSSILPDEAVFADFKKQCLSTDNWLRKYDKDDMQVWVEQPPATKGNHVPKIHKIKVSSVSLSSLQPALMGYLTVGGLL